MQKLKINPFHDDQTNASVYQFYQFGNDSFVKFVLMSFFMIIFQFSVVLAVGIGLYFINLNENSTETKVQNQTEITSNYSSQSLNWIDNEEIKIFQKYLQFPTVSLEADFGNY